MVVVMSVVIVIPILIYGDGAIMVVMMKHNHEGDADGDRVFLLMPMVMVQHGQYYQKSACAPTQHPHEPSPTHKSYYFRCHMQDMVTYPILHFLKHQGLHIPALLAVLPRVLLG